MAARARKRSADEQRMIDTATNRATPQAAAPDFSADTDAAPATGNVLDHVTRLVQRMRDLARDFTLAEQNLEAIANDINNLTRKLIPDAMEAAGLKDITLKDGSKLVVSDDVKVSVTVDNKPAAYAWLREQGHGAVIKQAMEIDLRAVDDKNKEKLEKFVEKMELQRSIIEDVHHSTLKALTKELLESGVTIPDSFSVFEFKIAKLKESKAR